MADYPSTCTALNHSEPVPRRIRAVLGSRTMLDTIRARYVWEWPYYPQYYVPATDVRMDLLTPSGPPVESPQGRARPHRLDGGPDGGPDGSDAAARVFDESPVAGVAGTVRFEWGALDHWFEEGEEVWVHPRSPYVRVDALPSDRTVRIEAAGALIATSSAPVMVFETGLPTRHYLRREDIDLSLLVPSSSRTECPYKGRTSGYWSVLAGDGAVVTDVAWTYDFPTRQLLPVAGLIGFLDERLDVFVDGVHQPRPHTHMG